MSQHEEIVKQLAQTDLFAGLTRRVLRHMADGGRVREFAPGAQVVAEGDSITGWHKFSPDGVEMFVVLTGSGVVTVAGQTHGKVGPGDYVGELALIDGSPRSASITASEEGMTAFAINKWSFDELLEEHPQVAVPMLHVLCARLRASEAEAAQPVPPQPVAGN
jgi:CRP/FNR family transcriptional regulator, cyclic AMP receptor protein